MHLIRESH